MNERYRNKYRIASARHPAWDYGWNAAYFVTICTKNRICWFGDIIEAADEQQMQFSNIGKIANQCWLEIPAHFPFVKLGNHIIMPNHVHGIIIIDKPDDPDETDVQYMQRRDAKFCVSTTNTSAQPMNRFGPQSKNLASIIRGFKIGVTKNARQINPKFVWQPRFHDHIIRNEKSFNNISQYIMNNPSKWTNNKFHIT